MNACFRCENCALAALVWSTKLKILNKEYLSYCKEQLGLSEHSSRAYAQDLRAFGAYAGSRQLASPPEKADIISYQTHLREEREASPTTIRRRMVTLKSYFQWLEDNDPSVMSPF
jgi:integrase/recombinase XerD